MTVIAILVLAAGILAMDLVGWPWGASEYEHVQGSIEREVHEFMATRELK